MDNKDYTDRLKYHFEPKKGWMNDPNGLCRFDGKYHAFFQYNPFARVWGRMHWGHAVSEDLVNWEELPIALFPDKDYESSGGCYSGSAIEKDGVLYLFYTSVSEKLGQTQSVATSRDGIRFEKYGNNPVIAAAPKDGSREFRDPKVFEFGGKYMMVCGSGKDGVGKILLFESEDLLNWSYKGVLFEDKSCGKVLECPDFFKLGEDYVLMFSVMKKQLYSTVFVVGSFDGENFVEKYRVSPEAGPHFYAPQTFFDGSRRIMIGWMYSWTKAPDKNADYAGALSAPRELKIVDGKLLSYPVKELSPFLKAQCDGVRTDGKTLFAFGRKFGLKREAEEVAILEDTKTVEIFINGGEQIFTLWKKKDTFADRLRYNKERLDELRRQKREDNKR